MADTQKVGFAVAPARPTDNDSATTVTGGVTHSKTRESQSEQQAQGGEAALALLLGKADTT